RTAQCAELQRRPEQLRLADAELRQPGGIRRGAQDDVVLRPGAGNRRSAGAEDRLQAGFLDRFVPQPIRRFGLNPGRRIFFALQRTEYRSNRVVRSARSIETIARRSLNTLSTGGVYERANSIVYYRHTNC